MTADLDLIRRAANQMRELAEAATPGPWGNRRGPGEHVVSQLEGIATVISLHPREDRRHIAKWDPVTALAVADSLDHDATAWEEYAKQGRRFPFARRERVLAVARAFLKEDADV